MASAEAVQLFVDRARAVQPVFALTPANTASVDRICQGLDGIPLAAARIRVLTAEQIADRLSDALRLLSKGSRTALPRHRTLRGTLEWSYAILNEWEQVLLQRLSAFAGSFFARGRGSGLCRWRDRRRGRARWRVDTCGQVAARARFVGSIGTISSAGNRQTVRGGTARHERRSRDTAAPSC